MPGTNEAAIRASALAWKDGDPDPTTRDELAALLEKPLADTDLADRFAASLEFGTAGLRGVIGAGPNRMNRAVVRRTSAGLAAYVLAHVPDARTRGIVIGYDGRTLSREMAEDSAGVFAAAGLPAKLFSHVAATPLTSFATKHHGAAAGVMVTASHNPAEYNGYKVYWTNSAQIISPIDAGIAAAIGEVGAAKDVPLLSLAEATSKGLLTMLGEETERVYLDAIAKLGVHEGGAREMPIVYTAMHGVGNKLAMRAFAEASFTHVVSVPEQAEPDAKFPTVAFPNPEEKGAMDLSLALARKTHADLVIANDPDADRLAVAIPDASLPSGYRQLTGNQVGVLLGTYLLTEGPTTGKRVMLASLVSSPMLGHICAELGVHYEETLTGFKWIANRAMHLETTEGYQFVFGYEEALGYTVGDVVRDKDGISAARLVAEMAAFLKGRGSSLGAELERVYRRFGLYVSEQVSLTRKGIEGAKEISAIMTKLRAEAPKVIGEHQVVALRDLESGLRTAKDGSTTPIALPKSNVLIFELEGGHRIIARPSGTEPKAKLYYDVKEAIREGESVAAAEARATENIDALKAAMDKRIG
jgi:phosphomannomutase